MKMQMTVALLVLITPSSGCTFDAATPSQPTLTRDALTVEATLALDATNTTAESTRHAPLVTGGYIGVEGWSADAEWLAYTLTEWVDDPISRLRLSSDGWLHFYNRRSGEDCTYPDPITASGDEHTPKSGFVKWLPNGEVIVYNEADDAQGVPCGDFVALPSDAQPPNPAVSPMGRYRAETIIVEYDEAAFRLTARTTLIEIETGRQVASATWITFPGVGGPGSGEWIGPDRYLVWCSMDPGPLLLSTDGSLMEVASELFHRPAIEYRDPDDRRMYLAAGRQVEGQDTYHIALTVMNAAETFHTTWLYHSETGDIETIPFRPWWQPTFSPDGLWMALYEPQGDEGDSFGMWMLPVDPAGSLPVEVAEEAGPALFSPDWSMVAFHIVYGTASHVEVYKVQTGEHVGSWPTGSYLAIPQAWSPDGRYLAATGHIPGQPESGLFLIELP